MNATPKLNEAAEGGSSPVPCSRSSVCHGPTHYAGCACHEKGWQNKWECAVEMAARAEVERDMWKANHDNQVAIKRIIAARPDLKDRAPMVEKLMAERNRAQAHSIRQHERIKQLESVPAKEMLASLLERVKSGAEAPEDVAEYRHLAGEISAWGAKFAEAMRRRDERASRKRISSANAGAMTRGASEMPEK